jgi:acyl-CoA dehydrogenase
MDFSPDPELESIQREAEKLAAAFGDDYWLDHDERKAFPWDFYNAFAAQGWLGILIPEKYGGAALGVLQAGTLLRSVAASGGAMNAASTLHMSIFGMAPVIHHGSEAMKERYLPPVARGELHVSFGVTEDDAGTDTSRIRTFARREGDHFIVNGKKVHRGRRGYRHLSHPDLRPSRRRSLHREWKEGLELEGSAGPENPASGSYDPPRGVPQAP